MNLSVLTGLMIVSHICKHTYADTYTVTGASTVVLSAVVLFARNHVQI